MRTVFFIPPLTKISGGLASISELASLLAASGRECAAVSPVPDCPGMQLLDPAVKRLEWDTSGQGAFLRKGDLWCIPDGWLNALVPGVKAGAGVLMYVQNWAFMISTRPEGAAWSQLPLAYLPVSGPVDWFLREILGLHPLGILPPAIKAEFFASGEKNGSRVRVAWMPRKNKALAEQIQGIASVCLEREKAGIRLEYVEIHGKSHEQVASLLQSCHIFLSTGFPEGFALPPLEAMASGCVPVGFSGLGGFEYMRNPEDVPLAGLWHPPFPLEEKTWGANGLFVSDGDVLGAGMALAWAVKEAHARSARWREYMANARAAANWYTLERRKTRLASVWQAIEAAMPPLAG